LPYNGTVKKFTSSKSVAPLEIRGDVGSNYLVKLVNDDTNKTVMTIFVRSGSTVNVDVPLGNYKFKYASGIKWYGYKHLFGPDTSFNMADRTFNFIKIGYRISGYTVTLYKVFNGNLRTYNIDASQF
jgi:hypothetical protein